MQSTKIILLQMCDEYITLRNSHVNDQPYTEEQIEKIKIEARKAVSTNDQIKAEKTLKEFLDYSSKLTLEDLGRQLMPETLQILSNTFLG